MCGMGDRKESLLLLEIHPRASMAVHPRSVELAIPTAFWF